MKKNGLFAVFLIPVWVFSQTPTDDPHWQLIWEDNFNNLDNWELANDFDHWGEQQVYLDDNVSITPQGELKLTIENIPYTCSNLNTWACNRSNYNYRSGWINSKNTHNMHYGYVEARIKVPYGVGFWPAFWLFGDDPTMMQGDYEEIDVFEINAGRVENCLTNYGQIGLVHDKNWLLTGLPPYGVSYTGNNCHDNIGIAYVPDYTQYHRYGIEWTPSKLIWYIDDRIVRVSPNIGLDHIEQIIFNVAISNYTAVSPSTVFPSAMYVDYVKLYNTRNECSTIINTCSFNFATYTESVKKSITIGGSGCANSVPVNTSQFLRATDGITINGDFTVPLGAALYLDANACY